VDEELHGNRRCSGTPSVAELKKKKKKRQFVAAAFSFSRFFTGGVPPHLYVQVCFQIHVRSAPRFVSEKEGQPERRPLSRKKNRKIFVRRSALKVWSLRTALSEQEGSLLARHVVFCTPEINTRRVPTQFHTGDAAALTQYRACSQSWDDCPA